MVEIVGMLGSEITYCGDITENQHEFLVRELGEYYIDIIEMEWDMCVKDFCREYLEWDDSSRRWVSLV